MAIYLFEQDVVVPEDRKVVIQLPPEVPVGVRLTITIRTGKRPRTSLSAWAKENAEDLGPDIKSTDVEGFTGRRYFDE